uniref:G_PROTEIN_RECEP_F1_2 domain-containing protein n=1 Tax=Elaeophora elaphi TaxID=1147741 RepID=A0A0R3RJP0_9BILA
MVASNGPLLHLARTNSQFCDARGILCNSYLICNLQTSVIPRTWYTIVQVFTIMFRNSELEDGIAIACIATTAVLGLSSNGISLYIASTRSRFRNAFGILCRSFLICNLQAIFALSAWCIIVLSVKSEELSSPELFFTRPIGVFVNGPYYGSLFVHFLISLNRFCAFAYATKYNQLWSESRALIAGIMSWVLGTTISMGHLDGGCSLTFHKNYTYRFSYSRSVVGKICSTTDALITTVAITSTACIDLITLTKILAYRRRMQETDTVSSAGESSGEGRILFFRQSCILGLIYVFYIFTMVAHPYIFTNKWLLFASSTVSWILVQSMDG